MQKVCTSIDRSTRKERIEQVNSLCPFAGHKSRPARRPLMARGTMYRNWVVAKGDLVVDSARAFLLLLLLLMGGAWWDTVVHSSFFLLGGTCYNIHESLGGCGMEYRCSDWVLEALMMMIRCERVGVFNTYTMLHRLPPWPHRSPPCPRSLVSYTNLRIAPSVIATTLNSTPT